MIIKQKGNALLLALLLVTVCTIVVVAVVDNQNMELLRTEMLLQQAQMQAYAGGVQQWAALFLQSDFYTQAAKKHQTLSWPKILQYQTQNGFSIQGSLYDAQGFYNLNNLSDDKYQSGFSNLLSSLMKSTDQQTIDAVYRATKSFISPEGKNSDVASEAYYLTLKPPYVASHQFFISPTEWRLVKGVTPQMYVAVSPYLIALPKVTPININTASTSVLMGLSNDITLEKAQEIITYRHEHGDFLTDNDLNNLAVQLGVVFDQTLATTQSEYFLLKTEIKSGNHDFVMFNLYDRIKASDSNYQTKLLWTSLGTL